MNLEYTIRVCAHIVSIRWWGDKALDEQALKTHAEQRVREMILQNYCSGELLYEDESATATGWWAIQNA